MEFKQKTSTLQKTTIIMLFSVICFKGDIFRL